MLDALPVPSVDGPRWALFLDVDGTVLELADRPDAVKVHADLISLLVKARLIFEGAFALVSGRSIAELDRLFQGTEVDIVGSHGAEIRRGRRTEILSSTFVDVMTIADQLSRWSCHIPGILIETKISSVAFHFRNAALSDVHAYDICRQAISGQETSLYLLKGKKVVEVVSNDISKGGALARLLQDPPYRDKLPVFVGDDFTDEDGFYEVNNRGGVSIHVGSDNAPTLAHYRIPDVRAVKTWLAHLISETCMSSNHVGGNDAKSESRIRLGT